MKHYVFLDIKNKRLIITINDISSRHVIRLMDSTDIEFCKIYCMGFIAGSDIGIKVINKMEEFK